MSIPSIQSSQLAKRAAPSYQGSEDSRSPKRPKVDNQSESTLSPAPQLTPLTLPARIPSLAVRSRQNSLALRSPLTPLEIGSPLPALAPFVLSPSTPGSGLGSINPLLSPFASPASLNSPNLLKWVSNAFTPISRIRQNSGLPSPSASLANVSSPSFSTNGQSILALMPPPLPAAPVQSIQTASVSASTTSAASSPAISASAPAKKSGQNSAGTILKASLPVALPPPSEKPKRKSTRTPSLVPKPVSVSKPKTKEAPPKQPSELEKATELFNQARTLFHQKKYQLAIPLFMKVIYELNFDDRKLKLNACLILGCIFRKLNNLPASNAVADKGIFYADDMPTKFQYLQWQAENFRILRNWDEAIKRFCAVIGSPHVKQESKITAYYDLALCLIEKNFKENMHQAIELLKESLRLMGTSDNLHRSFCHNALSKSLVLRNQTGDFALAKSHCELGLRCSYIKEDVKVELQNRHAFLTKPTPSLPSHVESASSSGGSSS